MNTWSHCGTVVEYRIRDPEVPSSNSQAGSSQAHWEQYHYQSLCTRDKYFQLSEVKSRSSCGTVVECWTRDPEVPSSNPGTGFSQVQSEQYHHKFLYTRFKYLKLTELKTTNYHGTVVVCRIRYLEVPSSNPSMGKRKVPTGPMTTISTPIPVSHSYIPEIVRGENQKWPLQSGRVQVRDSEVLHSSTSVDKRKILPGPIRVIPPPIPLHQS